MKCYGISILLYGSEGTSEEKAWDNRDADLQKDSENIMDGIYEQRGSCKENRNRKVTCTLNQKEKVDISRTQDILQNLILTTCWIHDR